MGLGVEVRLLSLSARMSHPLSLKAVACATAPPRLCPEKVRRSIWLRSLSKSLASARSIAAKCSLDRLAKPRCRRGVHGRSMLTNASHQPVPHLIDSGAYSTVVISRLRNQSTGS